MGTVSYHAPKLISLGDNTRKRDALGAGLEAAGTGLTVGLPYAFSRTTNNLTASQDEEYRRKLIESGYRSEYALPGGPKPLSWSDPVGSVVENVAYGAPIMGAEALGGIGGGILGSAGGPGGALAGTALGVAAVGAPLYAGSNVERATQGGQRQLTAEQAQGSLAMAPIQGGIDAGAAVVGARLVPGLNRLVGLGAPGEISGNLLRRVAVGGTEGGLTGVGQGVGQSAAQRYAVGESLTSEEAGQEYGQAATLGGVLGAGLGGAFGTFHGGRRQAAPEVMQRGPVPEDRPTSLLSLPTPDSFREPVYVDAEGVATTSMDQLNRSRRETAEYQKFQSDQLQARGDYVGQGDLFGKDSPMASEPEGVYSPDTAVPLSGEGQPSLFTAKATAAVRVDFGPREVGFRLRAGEKPDGYTLKLANQIADLLGRDDVLTARQMVDAEAARLQTAGLKPANLERRMAVIERAHQTLNDYAAAQTRAYAEEAAQRAPEQGAVVEAPPAPVGAEPVAEQNAAASHEEQLAQAHQLVGDKHRDGILQGILSDPNTRDHSARFMAILKRNNLEPAIRENELTQIEQTRALAEKRTDTEAAFGADRATRVQSEGVNPDEFSVPRETPEPVAEPAKIEEPAQPPEPAQTPEPERVEPKVEPRPETEEPPLTPHEQLEADVETSFAEKGITAKDFTQLKKLIANSADPEMIRQALEDAKDLRAGSGVVKPEQRSGLPRDTHEADSQRVPFLMAELRKRLARAGLHDIAGDVVTRLEHSLTSEASIHGQYDPIFREIMVIANADKSMADHYVTIDHEMMHALEDLGLITDKEKEIMWQAVKKDPGIMEFAKGYADRGEGAVKSEAIAEGFATYRPATSLGLVRGVLRRIQNFFEAAGNAFKGLGFKSVEDVFKAAREGGIGSRDRNSLTNAQLASVRRGNDKVNANLFKKGNTSTLYGGAENLVGKPAARMVDPLESLPKAIREPAEGIRDTLKGLPRRAAVYMALSHDIIDMMAKAIPSARKYFRLVDERAALAKHHEEQFIQLSEKADKLPEQYRGRGEGTVNGFIEKSTREYKWGFAPDYAPNAKVDPAMKAEFDAMPKPAQDVIRETFALARETLLAKKRAVLDMANTEYDALIAAADKAGDQGQVARLKSDKSKAVGQFSKLLAIDESKPYAPLRRFGDWVVAGYSKEYLAEEKHARATGDYTKLQEMQKDADHYFVDFAETRAGAARLERMTKDQYDHVEPFKADEASQMMAGGREMFHAFQRIRDMVDNLPSGDSAKRYLQSTINDLYLGTLAQASSRKAEMVRRNIAGGPGGLDMLRGAIAQGRADSHFIGAVYKNGEILDSITRMKEEAKRDADGNRTGVDRERNQDMLNEVLMRHASNMAPPPKSALADKLTNLTAFNMLITSPSFYVQQLMQPFVMSVPVAAAKHGYGRTAAALARAYKTVADSHGKTGVTDAFDLDALPEKYRALAHFLSERNRLDVGIDKEMGRWASDGDGALSNAWSRVYSKLRGMTRKSEAFNRLATAIMAVDLETQTGKLDRSTFDADAYRSYVADATKNNPGIKPMSADEFAAANYAMRLIDQTHGTYDTASAPRFMRGPIGQVLTQFKKFQIMQVSLYTRMINNAFFDKSVPHAEQIIARKALAYSVGHAALFAGALGLPGMNVAQALYKTVLSNKDETRDFEHDLRKAVGNDTVANLLLRGAPSLAGVDLSGSLGQANLLSAAPYADLTPDKDGYKNLLTAMAGPSIGGLGTQFAGGLDMLSQGQTLKAAEAFMPKGLANAVRAFREATGGVTNRRGEVVDRPDIGQTLTTAAGLRSTATADRQYRQGQAIESKEFYVGQARKLKAAYVRAVQSNDRERMRQLQKDWLSLQDAADKNGIRRQPLSDLIKSPKDREKREGNTLGGVQYDKRNQAQAEELADITGIDE